MIPWNVLVASFGDNHLPAQLVRQRVTTAWKSARPLRINTVDAEKIGDEMEHADAVLLLLDACQDDAMALRLLARLDDAGIAVLTLTDARPGERNPYAFASTLVEPILIEDSMLVGKLEGVLSRQSEVRRLRDEVALARRFHGGLRTEIARIHEELQLAAMVQREFLPREMPKLYDLDFAALWRPASYVSGDVYDVSQLDADHVGVFLADAVGHGVPAALMAMVICRALTITVRGETANRMLAPSEVLDRLNREMIRRQGRSTRFATAVYAIVNCRTKKVRLAGAGHPPPLLLEATTGAMRPLETDGSLLGIFDGETFGEIEMTLSPGDRLLFYSDGFEQAFPRAAAGDARRLLPSERYRDELARLAEEPSPQAMIRTINGRIDDQQGSLHQADDITLVCVHAGATGPAQDADTAVRRLHLA
jgi:serine phosphatase RsbU (regulator of sigma subunit)